MGLIYIGLKFVRYALDSWSTLILGENFGMTTSVAAYWSTAFDWIGFARRDRRRLLVGPHAGRAAHARDLLDDRGLPRLHRCDVDGRSHSPVLFIALLGLIGFTAMGPDSLLSGACAMDVGSRRQAVLAAGIINGFGSIGPILQEPAIGWLKQTQGLDAVFLMLVDHRAADDHRHGPARAVRAAARRLVRREGQLASEACDERAVAEERVELAGLSSSGG